MVSPSARHSPLKTCFSQRPPFFEEGNIMWTSKQRCRRSGGRAMLLLCLLGACLGMGNVLSGGNAGGQPPQEQVPPPPTANGAQPAPVLFSQLAPALSGSRTVFNFVINPDTPLEELLPIPPTASA